MNEPDTSPACLADLVTQISKRFRRATAAEIAPLGLTVAQAQVLRLFVAEGGSRRMADVAAELAIVPRSATSMVDALEEHGLVERHPDTRDRRSILVSLTAAGRRVLDGINSVRRKTAEELFCPLEPGDRHELARLLGAVVRHPGQTPMPSPPGETP